MKSFVIMIVLVCVAHAALAQAAPEPFLSEQIIPENTIFCVLGKAQICHESYFRIREKVRSMTDEIALAFVNLTTEEVKNLNETAVAGFIFKDDEKEKEAAAVIFNLKKPDLAISIWKRKRLLNDPLKEGRFSLKLKNEKKEIIFYGAIIDNWVLLVPEHKKALDEYAAHIIKEHAKKISDNPHYQKARKIFPQSQLFGFTSPILSEKLKDKGKDVPPLEYGAFSIEFRDPFTYIQWALQFDRKKMEQIKDKKNLLDLCAAVFPAKTGCKDLFPDNPVALATLNVDFAKLPVPEDKSKLGDLTFKKDLLPRLGKSIGIGAYPPTTYKFPDIILMVGLSKKETWSFLKKDVLSKSPFPLNITKTTQGNLTMDCVDIPFPFPVKISVLEKNDYLFLSNSAKLISEAFGKNTFTSSEIYKAMDIPQENYLEIAISPEKVQSQISKKMLKKLPDTVGQQKNRLKFADLIVEKLTPDLFVQGRIHMISPDLQKKE